MRVTLAVLIVVCCAVSLVAGDKKTSVGPGEFVKALNAKYRAGDLQGILGSMDENVLIFVSDEPQPWAGKSAVEQKLRAFFSEYRIVNSGERDFYTQQQGEMALVAYLYETEMQHAGRSVKVSGKETYVLRRDGDSWKVVHDHLSANR